MDKSAIKDGLGQVERELEDARQALRQLEAEILYHETSGGFEDARDVLRRSLGQAYEMLALVLEAGGLADTRMRLIEQWNKFEKKDLGAIISGADWLGSEPLEYIDTILRGLGNANDKELMLRAIFLANDCKPIRDGIPKVGAVIAIDGTPISSGRRGNGGDENDDRHAEHQALEKVDDKTQLPHATLYTTLEPCTKEVRTKEPECCSELIIQHKIKKVFIGILDPNQGVAGKGISRLQESDIEVELFPPDLAKQIKSTNAAFIRTQQTLDARIISPKNGECLKTYTTGGIHTIQFTCRNSPTHDTYLLTYRNGLWWPQPQSWRNNGSGSWEIDAYFGATGEHTLHIVTANELGKALIQYYERIANMNRERKAKLSPKLLDEADRSMLLTVNPGIPMIGLPKGLRSEAFIVVNVAERPKEQ